MGAPLGPSVRGAGGEGRREGAGGEGGGGGGRGGGGGGGGSCPLTWPRLADGPRARWPVCAWGTPAAARGEARLGVREGAASTARTRGGDGFAPCWWISQDAPPAPLHPAASPRLPSVPRARGSRASAATGRLLLANRGGEGSRPARPSRLRGPGGAPGSRSPRAADFPPSAAVRGAVRARSAPRGKGPRLLFA